MSNETNGAEGATTGHYAFTIQRAALMALAGRAVAISRRAKAAMATHGTLLLEAGADGTVRASATDLETTVVGSAPAAVTEPGRVVVPAAMLYDAAKVLPGDTLKVEGHSREMVLTSGRARVAVRCQEPEGFPRLPVPPDAMPEIDGAVLGRLLRAVQVSVSRDESRPNLNGIYLSTFVTEGGGCELRAVSTDGHRLSQEQADAGTGVQAIFGDLPGFILPSNGASDVLRMLGDVGVGRMALADNNIVFASADRSVTLFVRMIDATFPDYRQVVPKGKPTHRVTLDRARLLEGVTRMRVAAEQKTNGLRLAFGSDLAGGVLTLKMWSPDRGSAQDEIPCEWDGDPFEMAVNLAYVKDALESFDVEQVDLRMNEALSPLVVVPHQSGAEAGAMPNDLRVIMPMRI